LYNFGLPPSLTLGCGSWGGNSVGENVGVKHLMNVKVIAERRENMLWLRIPPRTFIRRGSLGPALTELKSVLGRKRVMVVTDEFMFSSGAANRILDKLDELGLARDVFFEVEPDPTLSCARKGAERLSAFKPDAIVAFGGGSAMDAAKIMRLLYEKPQSRFEDLSMRFMDIRKRIRAFPELTAKSYFVAVPTTAGTGSEVTPFAVITDDATGIKYPLADYALTPDMAITDADVQMGAPKGLTAASGIDAATHALESWASMLASD
jgi:acetaldehyde dehydrogenase/alcohol dehydrogenase